MDSELANASPSVQRIAVRDAESAADLAEARDLFLEYAQSLGFSLCFQGFDKELEGLPGKYARPNGRLLLAKVDGKTAGCVALRALESGACEMKRLFVRPEFRGLGLGRVLAERIIAEARAIGYYRMRLDTIASTMADAVALYRRLGFVEIPPYCVNAIPDALYMELVLKKVE
jgi:ribosomal protein S18 acetylase RimI-like enzyme